MDKKVDPVRKSDNNSSSHKQNSDCIAPKFSNGVDSLLSELVIKLGFANKDTVEKCLEIQQKLPQEKSLGMIMMEQGYLTTEQTAFIANLKLDTTLNYEPNLKITCPKCATNYNVILFNPGARFLCWKCDNELTVPNK